MKHLLADTLLFLHALFIAFVVAGLVLILLGGALRWAWVRNLWFRAVHLLSIGYVVAEAWCGVDCPLTVWENNVRRGMGEPAYAESFVAHWLHRIFFHDFPPPVFTMAYTIFGMLVLLTLFLVPPRTGRRV